MARAVLFSVSCFTCGHLHQDVGRIRCRIFQSSASGTRWKHETTIAILLQVLLARGLACHVLCSDMHRTIWKFDWTLAAELRSQEVGGIARTESPSKASSCTHCSNRGCGALGVWDVSWWRCALILDTQLPVTTSVCKWSLWDWALTLKLQVTGIFGSG